MIYNKDFSVIIPHRNSVHLLPRLFASIPESEKIEIILVDNSPNPISKGDIGIDRDYVLLYSLPERGAGGARNEGIGQAQGKWLVFADADDFFAEGAFELFESMVNTDADIVYTQMGGIYDDTGEPSDRGDRYVKLVRDYLQGACSENELRFFFSSPCCKMVSHKLVDEYKLKYDEIPAGNDVYFSLTCGYYAKKIEAIEKVTYIATVSRGSLTNRRDYEIIKSRLYSILHCNKFLRQHKLNNYQRSIMSQLYESRHFGLMKMMGLLKMIAMFRQNPFIGCFRWWKSFFEKKETDKRDNKYILN